MTVAVAVFWLLPEMNFLLRIIVLTMVSVALGQLNSRVRLPANIIRRTCGPSELIY